MKSIIKLFVVTTMISLCASCSNDETVNGDNSNCVQFSASVEYDTKTRSVESTPYTGTLTLWNGSVKGGVSADYTYSNNTWSANPPLFWDNLSSDGSGLYTFYATANHSTLNEGATDGVVAADQSANDGYAKADLLAAYAESTKRNQTLSFNLKHLMAQFTVVLNNSTDANAAFTADQLHGATVAAKSLHADYTATWGATASITSGTAADKLTDITLCPDAANASASTGLIYRAIVPAGQTLGNVQINIDGKPYTININHAINAGENTVQTLNVAKTGISLGAVSVTNWVENNLGDAALAINIAGTNSGTDATLFTDMSIWKRGSSVESDKQNALIYKKAAGVWAFDAASNSGKAPFYLDDVVASDQFYASAVNRDVNGNPISDAQTNLLDGLIARPASVSHTTGGALNLEFHHAFAQLTVVVKAGSSLPVSISLIGAKITTPSMIQNASTALYNADGSLSLVASGTASPYNLVTTYDAAKSQAELTAIVVPQKLVAGSKFTVTLANGNAYTATLDNEVNLNSAQNNALTLTVNPTAAKIAAVTVADWGTGADAAADATLDGVTISAETLNGISEDGGLAVSVINGESGYLTGLYPIVYTSGVASVNTASTNYTPILWDEMPQYSAGATLNSYSYKALFVPANSVSGNQDRDYLQTEGATAATPWGITPSFTLKHAMGKLVVKLQSDGTYTADQLKAATLTFTSAKYVYGYSDAELTYENASRTITMSNASGTADALGTYTAIVCPQSITGIKLVIAGKTFNLTTNIALATGSIHTLTASVNKSVVKIGTVNVNDWGEGGSSTGSFQY
ncbi:fimbrillin family protein [Phocaeicola paurosaccharolyticus]|uniref:fimbrillin family protein n=1 Tax=Phocaeicola paurosaccharolyticus TaxID=732242 RepID=UPI000A038942|nr:fimbrillin family protein [Phocaeicola paurosaccharolyticus]